jgi:hypothetical protein
LTCLAARSDDGEGFVHEETTMDVDKVIALISAAGIELIDRRRNRTDDGWSLSFSNGAELDVRDNGQVAVSGKGGASVASLLGLPDGSTGRPKSRS